MSKMDSKRIEINLANGDRLVAETDLRSVHNEIYVGIVDENDSWVQDLVLVRQNYVAKEDPVSRVTEFHNIEDSYEVLVFADDTSEDFTDSFTIERAHI